MLHICRLHGIGLWDWNRWMWARSLWAWVLWWPDQWLLLFLWEGMDWKKLWNWYWWLHGKAMSEWGLLQWSSTWLSVSMSTSVQRKELRDWYQWVWSKPMSGKGNFYFNFFQAKDFPEWRWMCESCSWLLLHLQRWIQWHSLWDQHWWLQEHFKQITLIAWHVQIKSNNLYHDLDFWQNQVWHCTMIKVHSRYPIKQWLNSLPIIFLHLPTHNWN